MLRKIFIKHKSDFDIPRLEAHSCLSITCYVDSRFEGPSHPALPSSAASLSTTSTTCNPPSPGLHHILYYLCFHRLMPLPGKPSPHCLLGKMYPFFRGHSPPPKACLDWPDRVRYFSAPFISIVCNTLPSSICFYLCRYSHMSLYLEGSESHLSLHLLPIRLFSKHKRYFSQYWLKE